VIAVEKGVGVLSRTIAVRVAPGAADPATRPQDALGGTDPAERFVLRSVGRTTRILHVAETALGGISSYLNHTIPELVHQWERDGEGVEMRLLVPESHAHSVNDVPPGLLRTYHREGRTLADQVRLGRAAVREMRDFRPDVVHVHSTFAGAVVRPLATALRRTTSHRFATVYCAHGWAFEMEGSALRNRMVARTERMLTALTDRVVMLSDHEREHCLALGFPAERLTRIYHGIGTQAPATRPVEWQDERLKVLFVGRFDRQKGLDLLIEAVRPLGDHVTLHCAGANVTDREGALDVPDNVRFLGWLDEPTIAGWMQQADIVVMPSRWEGLGLVALEAMRASRPVIASRVGGLQEVVADGDTGILVPPGDVAALRAALLSTTPESRARMGAAGRRRYLDRFTSARSVEQLRRLYREVLAALPAPARDGRPVAVEPLRAAADAASASR
jgi:glycosyltransferase involved in cell wall biosynthesis